MTLTKNEAKQKPTRVKPKVQPNILLQQQPRAEVEGKAEEDTQQVPDFKTAQLWSKPQELQLNLMGITDYSYMSFSKSALNPYEIFTSLFFKLQGLIYLVICKNKSCSIDLVPLQLLQHCFVLSRGGSEEGKEN